MVDARDGRQRRGGANHRLDKFLGHQVDDKLAGPRTVCRGVLRTAVVAIARGEDDQWRRIAEKVEEREGSRVHPAVLMEGRHPGDRPRRDQRREDRVGPVGMGVQEVEFVGHVSQSESTARGLPARFCKSVASVPSDCLRFLLTG